MSVVSGSDEDEEISLGTILLRYLDGFYPYWNHQIQRFYWDRKPTRTVIRLDKSVTSRASRMLAGVKHPFETRRSTRTHDVLAALSNPSSRSETWVTGPVVKVYRRLAGDGWLRTTETFQGEQLLGAVLAVCLPGVLLAETMYAQSHARWASKVALCQMVLDLERDGGRLIDVQVEHPANHPSAHLGESTVDLSEYLQELRSTVRSQDSGALESTALLLRIEELVRAGTEIPGLIPENLLRQLRSATGTTRPCRTEAPDPRHSKPFPMLRSEWLSSTPTQRDHEGITTLELCGFQVMQSWEAELMRAMAVAVSGPGRRVLEVGYGLGLCAGFIQEGEPELHVIVEANAAIAQAARARLAGKIENGRVVVVEGYWEEVCLPDVLEKLAGRRTFDGLVFDTFPHNAAELRRNHFAFFERARTLLEPAGVFTYFSDEAIALPSNHIQAIYVALGAATIEQSQIAVRPPSWCEYWSADTIVHVVVRTPLVDRHAEPVLARNGFPSIAGPRRPTVIDLATPLPAAPPVAPTTTTKPTG